MKQPDCPHEHCVDGLLELHGPELEIVPCHFCQWAAALSDALFERMKTGLVRKIDVYGNVLWVKP